MSSRPSGREYRALSDTVGEQSPEKDWPVGSFWIKILELAQRQPSVNSFPLRKCWVANKMRENTFPTAEANTPAHFQGASGAQHMSTSLSTQEHEAVNLLAKRGQGLLICSLVSGKWFYPHHLKSIQTVHLMSAPKWKMHCLVHLLLALQAAKGEGWLERHAYWKL